jgi:translation initiation factor IF-2
MGHVDHGKTSLLDKIRKSNVVSTEAGGITQVLRAWRVMHNGKPATFLDTPGHEAFTKMRARGANVTDIAVIVVAADDGVMPQTEEAINHAKAADVKIIVAINKVDLPNANIRKTEQMLYGLGLIPDSMGGEVPFVQTSAATGKGIEDLLETIALVAELEDLHANPSRRATGLCLEAHVSEGQGIAATFLVQDGTLRKGDVILCGSTFGRARMMFDDLGRPIEEAGPSMPVLVMGLEEVPNADDTFLVVPELQVAREIAEQRHTAQSEALQIRRMPMNFGAPGTAEIIELKVILKADFRGSVEAIRKEIEKLQHSEVRVRLLHAAVGGVTESDVQLALTSPEDTIIVGFNAVADDRAMALADERGVSIREYDIIYKLTEDLRAALEGRLKPREEIVHLGRTVVRDVFKISRVGTIAGCFVTQGTIERPARIRLIRGGVVIYPPNDRMASLESLKRFKDDVRDVREGLECGLRIAGYDDIKVDDVIEAFRIDKIQRTLS